MTKTMTLLVEKKEREKKANRKKCGGSYFSVLSYSGMGLWNWVFGGQPRHTRASSVPSLLSSGDRFPPQSQSSQSMEIRYTCLLKTVFN